MKRLLFVDLYRFRKSPLAMLLRFWLKLICIFISAYRVGYLHKRSILMMGNFFRNWEVLGPVDPALIAPPSPILSLLSFLSLPLYFPSPLPSFLQPCLNPIQYSSIGEISVCAMFIFYWTDALLFCLFVFESCADRSF